MKRLAYPAIAAVAAVASSALIGLGTPADAATTYFSSCANLTRVYPHGVSKSATAAARQVRLGYGRPSTTSTAKKVYATNASRLDRDRDGTACEG